MYYIYIIFACVPFETLFIYVPCGVWWVFLDRAYVSKVMPCHYMYLAVGKTTCTCTQVLFMSLEGESEVLCTAPVCHILII